ncbi:hypothetical protein LO762_26185 [Actinocorallia sp. API 0066]|uniref:hypothetical protein n=1 Tax=Actinocorallia sp. API 0066 TaxID=2896846 RepID=UPI001E33AB9F|nr:hypothetical protein [Actinocorallia sp. API 0066]MCD0452645.1 hypothetical protein [Actinocorallia sp. API 0066]
MTNERTTPTPTPTDDEITLGVAYAVLLPLLDRLAVRPFDRRVHAELRLHLDFLAAGTADAFDRLTARTPETLGNRALVIESLHVDAEGCADE